MQEILVVLSLAIAFIYVARLLFKSFLGQASTCGCACQGCHLGKQPVDKKALLPMYQSHPDHPDDQQS